MRLALAFLVAAALPALPAAAQSAVKSDAKVLAETFVSACVEPMMKGAPFGPGLTPAAKAKADGKDRPTAWHGPDGIDVVETFAPNDELRHCLIEPHDIAVMKGGTKTAPEGTKHFAGAFDEVVAQLTATDRFILVDEKDDLTGARTKVLWSAWPDSNGRFVVLSLTHWAPLDPMTPIVSLNATEVKPELPK